jgi:hypothetical protein
MTPAAVQAQVFSRTVLSDLAQRLSMFQAPLRI